MNDPQWISGEAPQYPPLPADPPIFEAARDCDAKQVARLLDEEPALVKSKLPNWGDQPLHTAAAAGCGKVVELLLDRGAEINARGNKMMTPLHLAAENGKAGVIKILLQRGADPSVLDVFGFTPLVAAARQFNERGYKTARAMLKAGVKYDLHAAICLGDVAKVSSLLSEEPNLAKSYEVPGDLLFDAILMVQSRTDDYDPPDLLNKSIREFGPICKLLVSHGVSPNEPSRWAEPPLHGMLYIEGLVRFLIELGADVNLVGPSGERPLQIAEREGRTTVAKLLREHGAR